MIARSTFKSVCPRPLTRRNPVTVHKSSLIREIYTRVYTKITPQIRHIYTFRILRSRLFYSSARARENQKVRFSILSSDQIVIDCEYRISDIPLVLHFISSFTDVSLFTDVALFAARGRPELRSRDLHPDS